ncbi:MAG: YtxH domain-containing protein [Bacteroidales bacterium]|nr:YtxH domain-containing protein [Bacteroidales bacterium]
MTKKSKSKKKEVSDKVKKEAEKIKKSAEDKVKETKEKASEVKEELEETAEDIKENLRKAGEEVSESSFWEETGESISEGARIVGGEARSIAEKISAYSEVVFGKIRDRSAEAFKSGLDLTREGANKAQAIADDLRDNIEVGRLNREKKEIASQLGMKFYLEIKNNNNKVPANILRKRVFMSLLKELENIDKKILELKDE